MPKLIIYQLFNITAKRPGKAQKTHLQDQSSLLMGHAGCYVAGEHQIATLLTYRNLYLKHIILQADERMAIDIESHGRLQEKPAFA
jgi:hypothetical protein